MNYYTHGNAISPGMASEAKASAVLEFQKAQQTEIKVSDPKTELDNLKLAIASQIGYINEDIGTIYKRTAMYRHPIQPQQVDNATGPAEPYVPRSPLEEWLQGLLIELRAIDVRLLSMNSEL